MTLVPAGSAADDDDPADSEQLEEQAQLLLPVILAKIEQHQHLPMQMPDLPALERMRAFDPSLYEQWRGMIERQHRHGMRYEMAPFETPARIARRGQWFGLAVVICVLALAGALVWKGEPGWAALITGIDIVALAAVFAKPGDSGK